MGTNSYLPIQVSCLGLEGNLQGDPCRFALTSRGPEGGIQRYVLQTADPAVSQAWIKQVAQILESQRDFLNGEAPPLPPPRCSLSPSISQIPHCSVSSACFSPSLSPTFLLLAQDLVSQNPPKPQGTYIADSPCGAVQGGVEWGGGGGEGLQSGRMA